MIDCQCFYFGVWMRNFRWSRTVFICWRLGRLRPGHRLRNTFLHSQHDPSRMGCMVWLPCTHRRAAKGALVPRLARPVPCMGMVCAYTCTGHWDKEKHYRGMHGCKCLLIYMSVYMCVLIHIYIWIYINAHSHFFPTYMSMHTCTYYIYIHTHLLHIYVYYGVLEWFGLEPTLRIT